MRGLGGIAEAGDEVGEQGGPGFGEIVFADDGKGFAELALDFGGGGEHERDDSGSDQVLLGVGDGGGSSDG